MNVRHELARVGIEMRRLGRLVAEGKAEPSYIAWRLAVFADHLTVVSQSMDTMRQPVTRLRRWSFLLTRRPIV